MLCGCFSFAWMTEFARLLRLHCDWRFTALARSLLAFLFALALARLFGARLVLWRPGILWVRSVAGSLSLLCTFYAFSLLPPSEVVTLGSTLPIWVALLSWPILREKPSLAVWLGVGCSVVGTVLIQHQHAEGSALSTQLAAPLVLFGACTSAIAMLGLHRLEHLDTWAIVVHFSGVASVFVLLALLVDPPSEVPNLDGQTLPLLLGVGATATLGQMCLTRAFTTGIPARVCVVGMSQVVFVLCLDTLFEPTPFPPPLTLAGILLVMAPTAWVMASRTES
jgi:drug/metabolite transporter (DMT)-like permease